MLEWISIYRTLLKQKHLSFFAIESMSSTLTLSSTVTLLKFWKENTATANQGDLSFGKTILAAA